MSIWNSDARVVHVTVEVCRGIRRRGKWCRPYTHRVIDLDSEDDKQARDETSDQHTFEIHEAQIQSGLQCKYPGKKRVGGRGSAVLSQRHHSRFDLRYMFPASSQTQLGRMGKRTSAALPPMRRSPKNSLRHKLFFCQHVILEATPQRRTKTI